MGATDERKTVRALQARKLDVDASSRRRAEYSSDASLYRVLPAAVVFPRTTDDLLAAVEVCIEFGTPLTVRGAGTSIAGNAVGDGIVVDVSRHLTKIRAIDPDALTAVVEPGVILDDLQRAAAPHGLRFGPDPSTHNRCTIGGMIGNNACGSRALRYGRTVDNVEALDVITGGRVRLQLGRHVQPDSSPTLIALHGVVRSRLDVIRTELGRFSRQVSGYSLEHLLPERGFDVARALVGTEGTCAVTLAATVRLVRAPTATALVLLGYADMATAADDVPALLPFAPIALEGIDARIVDIVRSHRGDSRVPPLPAGAGWLFVELAADTADDAADAAAELIRAASALDTRIVTDRWAAAQLWRIREDGAGLSARPPGRASRHAGWEDAAVPPERFGSYLRDFDALLVAHGLQGIPYGHFGDGCLHVRIDFPLGSPGGTGVFRRFLVDAAHLVAAHGGSMSGEHGDGRARSELLPIMYSDLALRAFAEVKAVFDPAGVLNPGIVVDPRPIDADLRLVPRRRPSGGLGFRYAEDGGDFAAAVHRCTGVGKCRADITGSGGVMCPSFLATRDEKDSTRGRARVLQEMISGTAVHGWRAPEVHQALDLCLACKGCSSDCPTGTDMAAYKSELLHQAYRGRVRPASHYALGWLPWWARLAGRAPRVANTVLSSPLAVPGKRLAGVDARRSLPSFAAQSFRHWFRKRPPAAGGDPILLWVDTFTDLFTPEVGRAAVAVLEDAGFAVFIPRRPLCCGLPLISTGQLDLARRVLRRAVEALTPAADAGVPIVGLEPSCTAVFRGDAAELLSDTSSAQQVGGAVRTLAELLSARPGWTPPDLTGLDVIAQPHCHQHAVMGWTTDRLLLERAGAKVRSVGGCCGLAGNFGVEKGHYDVSLAIAEHQLLPAMRAAPAAAVQADGFSCRTQIAELAGRRGRHLAELLTERQPERETPGS